MNKQIRTAAFDKIFRQHLVCLTLGYITLAKPMNTLANNERLLILKTTMPLKSGIV
jgi:hypothetical protein